MVISRQLLLEHGRLEIQPCRAALTDCCQLIALGPLTSGETCPYKQQKPERVAKNNRTMRLVQGMARVDQ